MTLVRNSVLAYRIRNSVLSFSDICQILRHIDNQKSTERRSRPRLLAQTPGGTRAPAPRSHARRGTSRRTNINYPRRHVWQEPGRAGPSERGSSGVLRRTLCAGGRGTDDGPGAGPPAPRRTSPPFSRVSHTDASYASWLLSPPVRSSPHALSVSHVSPPRHEDAARSCRLNS